MGRIFQHGGFFRIGIQSGDHEINDLDQWIVEPARNEAPMGVGTLQI